MKIIFPVEVYKRLRMYVDNVKSEISGFGLVNFIDGNVVVTDIKIFEQTVSDADTHLDAASIGKFILGLPKKDRARLKLWWHSHADMGVFFSGVDTATIDDFDNQTEENNWMVSLVTNHAGDTKTRMDSYFPFRATKEDIDFEIGFTDARLLKTIKEEIEAKVLQPVRPAIITVGKDAGLNGFDPNWGKKKRNGGGERTNGRGKEAIHIYGADGHVLSESIFETEEEYQEYLERVKNFNNGDRSGWEN